MSLGIAWTKTSDTLSFLPAKGASIRKERFWCVILPATEVSSRKYLLLTDIYTVSHFFLYRDIAPIELIYGFVYSKLLNHSICLWYPKIWFTHNMQKAPAWQGSVMQMSYQPLSVSGSRTLQHSIQNGTNQEFDSLAHSFIEQLKRCQKIKVVVRSCTLASCWKTGFTILPWKAK